MKPGSVVADFEREFARYVGADYAIALVNGTATLHTALVALGVKPGDRVAVPPLTMSSTTIAVLHVGAVPVFHDVDERWWLMSPQTKEPVNIMMPVSLFGLHSRHEVWGWDDSIVDDAAQTLRPHSGCAFTSYSFQSSKILSTGEGGMLVTNDGDLAQKAREFASLGYRLAPTSSRIDSVALRSPTFQRHHSLGWNYRMNDVTAREGLIQLEQADTLLAARKAAALCYRDVVQSCDWLTPQFVPAGWTSDWWAYAVAIAPERIAAWPNDFWLDLAKAIEFNGGERPYACWRTPWTEPGLTNIVDPYQRDYVLCPIAESLQPRLMLMQTNNLDSAQQNAEALSKAITEIG